MNNPDSLPMLLWNRLVLWVRRTYDDDHSLLGLLFDYCMLWGLRIQLWGLRVVWLGWYIRFHVMRGVLYVVRYFRGDDLL